MRGHKRFTVPAEMAEKRKIFQILAEARQLYLYGIRHTDISTYANTIPVEGFGTSFAA